MNRTTRYLLGGAFFFIVSNGILLATEYGNQLLNSIVYGTEVAVVLAIGLRKGPGAGAAFGLSSIVSAIAYTGVALYQGSSIYPLTFFLYPIIFNPIIMMTYGYLPSNRFFMRRTVWALVTGFVGAIFLDVVLTTISLAIYFPPPNVFQFSAFNWSSAVLLGLMSAGLSSRGLQSRRKPILPKGPENLEHRISRKASTPREDIETKSGGLSPEAAEERYNYLRSRPMDKLTDAEFEERLALVDRPRNPQRSHADDVKKKSHSIREAKYEVGDLVLYMNSVRKVKTKQWDKNGWVYGLE